MIFPVRDLHNLHPTARSFDFNPIYWSLIVVLIRIEHLNERCRALWAFKRWDLVRPQDKKLT